MKNTFKEEYEIIYDYQKDDGYWVTSAVESITVDVVHGVNEKNNHQKAKSKFQKMNPKARIKTVIYV